MRTRLCDENLAAEAKLPPATPDRSGIGVYYVDDYVRPLNATLEDGTKVACKRRGLKLTLTVGDRKGEGLMRRVQVSADPRVMLRAALAEAASAAGVPLVFEGGAIWLER